MSQFAAMQLGSTIWRPQVQSLARSAMAPTHLKSSSRSSRCKGRLSVQNRRGFDYEPDRQRRPGKKDKDLRFKIYQTEVSLPEDQLWRIVLPAVGILGLAAFIGPLVIGLSIGAVALGAAFSAGAIAFAGLLPLFVFLGIGGLLSLGSFATLGLALALPQLVLSALTLGVLGGGLLLGTSAVRWLLRSQNTSSDSRGSSRSWSKLPEEQQGYRSTIYGAYSSEREESSEEEVEERERAARTKAELKQFDEILAKRARQQQYDRDIKID